MYNSAHASGGGPERTETGPLNQPPAKPPGLLRRLAAIVYDTFLLAALLLICAAPLPLLPETVARGDVAHWAIRAAVLIISFLFLGWFWVHGGQTLGMRAWRIRVVSREGSPLSWADALRRYLAALLSWLPFGLGFLWSALDREGLAWHDRLSATHLVLLRKQVSTDPPQQDQAGGEKQ